MSNLYEEISKEVGYAKRKIEYPHMSEVRQAIERHNRQDIFNLVMWHRNLLNPETPRQVNIIHTIDDGLANMKV
jgi:hypothetical protein